MMLRLRQENDLLRSSISSYFHVEINSRMNMHEKSTRMTDSIHLLIIWQCPILGVLPLRYALDLAAR